MLVIINVQLIRNYRIGNNYRTLIPICTSLSTICQLIEILMSNRKLCNDKLIIKPDSLDRTNVSTSLTYIYVK